MCCSWFFRFTGLFLRGFKVGRFWTQDLLVEASTSGFFTGLFL